MSNNTPTDSPYRPLYADPPPRRPSCPDGFHVFEVGKPRCRCGAQTVRARR